MSLAEIWRRVSGFLSDTRGTAGLEFVTTSPLILGVLVFTAEYGQALRARMVLDSAVQDAARFLARSPVDNASTVPDAPEISFYPATLTEAQQMIRERVGQRPIAFNVSTQTVDSTQFRTPYYRISLDVTMSIDLPLLSIFNIFREPESGNTVNTNTPNPLWLTMKSDQLVRWVGGAAPGEADCILADRYQGLCP